MLKEKIVREVTKHPWLVERLRSLVRRTSPSRTILLDYPINSQPRYGWGKAAHPRLLELISQKRNCYRRYLHLFLNFKENFLQIPRLQTNTHATKPAWQNEMLPGLDSISLYGFLCLNNPHRYIEVGSGNSTKFARQAIGDCGLRTKIASIDPHPRVEIDSICDYVIRSPVEDLDLGIFEELEAGDILFVDNSHRVFMNSDATVIFMDVLPRLKAGVLVEFHDIYLPFDYPGEWGERYYSEQYLLAAYLLAEGKRFEIVLPNAFISTDEELSGILAPLWDSPAMEGVERYGGSFWIRMK
jgi:hypothetical protein